MKLKLWLWLIPLMFIVLGLSVWIGWSLLGTSNTAKSTEASGADPSVTQEDQDFSAEVVNTPVSESIIVFKNDELGFKNGHDFIGQLHKFYNETLGWGRIDTTSYSEQQEKAELIIRALENVEVMDAAVQMDFDRIKEYAEIVAKEDDREAMRNLHRYFHDLDIYFNGYDYKETFKVTIFQGEGRE
ncbi:hypothetical protein J27TS8_41230 [Robertmurraya siralis]|uniref:Uncharacterized protein n=1 Tax=Robertmurraya siralis TaxID=77777 RepID=A0A920BV98_9BACI|nr:hypothetical protein [Robertmurraya siralis]GIN64130.1 hypothetical protein J27TS8_41230 [Robertmurraya siralis]